MTNARRHMVVQLGSLPDPHVTGLRAITPADELPLAALMMSSYVGTIDYEGEDEAEALVEVRNTLGGNHGPFLEAFSHVVERENQLASSVLITRWSGESFVAFTMTAARFKRQGLARAGMMRAMHLLHLSGESQLRLLVTVANTDAVALYQSLGFAWEE